MNKKINFLNNSFSFPTRVKRSRPLKRGIKLIFSSRTTNRKWRELFSNGFIFIFLIYYTSAGKGARAASEIGKMRCWENKSPCRRLVFIKERRQYTFHLLVHRFGVAAFNWNVKSTSFYIVAVVFLVRSWKPNPLNFPFSKSFEKL